MLLLLLNTSLGDQLEGVSNLSLGHGFLNIDIWFAKRVVCVSEIDVKLRCEMIRIC